MSTAFTLLVFAACYWVGHWFGRRSAELEAEREVYGDE